MRRRRIYTRKRRGIRQIIVLTGITVEGLAYSISRSHNDNMDWQIKKWIIHVYNLKNAPWWKHGVIVEKQGWNILLDRVKIKNFGKHNKLILSDGVRIRKMSITFLGDYNIIEIGNDARMNNTVIRMEDSCNRISIGQKTTVGGNAIYP